MFPKQVQRTNTDQHLKPWSSAEDLDFREPVRQMKTPERETSHCSAFNSSSLPKSAKLEKFRHETNPPGITIYPHALNL